MDGIQKGMSKGSEGHCTSNHVKEAKVATGLLGVWMHSFGDRLKLLHMTQEKLLSVWERTGERLRRAWACHAFT